MQTPNGQTSICETCKLKESGFLMPSHGRCGEGISIHQDSHVLSGGSQAVPGKRTSQGNLPALLGKG